MKDIIKDFNKYVKNYDLSIKDIIGKYHYTFRVMEIIKGLSKSIGLNDYDIYLACVIAIYHDIARFKQFSEYNTFYDDLSFDHGLEGKKILETENLLYSFDNYEKSIILNCVLYHNKLEVPHIDDRTNMFIDLVREADRLDIMREQGLTIGEGYVLNEKIVNSIYKKEIANRKDRQVQDDCILVMLSGVLNLKYPYAYQFVKDYKIIENKFNLLELYGETEETKELKQFIYDEFRKGEIKC